MIRSRHGFIKSWSIFSKLSPLVSGKVSNTKRKAANKNIERIKKVPAVPNADPKRRGVTMAIIKLPIQLPEVVMETAIPIIR